MMSRRLAVSAKGLNNWLKVPGSVEGNPTYMLVVAAALRDGAGGWLMQQRPPGKHHAGLWEFPGGKVEPTEIPAEALIRELTEELGITLEPSDLNPLAFAEGGFSSSGTPIVILLYTADRWTGRLLPLEGGELGWFDAEALASLPMSPLDCALVGQLAARSRK